MATVNVYTYYTCKLAIEKAQKAQPRPKRPPVSFSLSLPVIPSLVKLGTVAGLLCFLALAVTCDPAQTKWLAGLGMVWGCCCGCLLETLRFRTNKFVCALKGMPLQADDRAALAGSR